MNTVETYTAIIYVGRKVRDAGEVLPIDTARAVLQTYCDEVGLCVTLTELEYVYTNGGEPGFAVGLINYPRFPSTRHEIKGHAMAIAQALKDAYLQYKVTVVFPDDTVMLSSEVDS